MIWLITVMCLLLYLALSVGVIRLAAIWANKHRRRRWPWCVAAGVFMYLLVAWDQVPTYLVTEYYCATQSGLTIYKTPEQWRLENPRVAEALTWRAIPPSKKVGEWGRDEFLNERIVYSTRIKSLDFLPVNISSHRLIDKSNGNELSRLIVIASGYDVWRRKSGISGFKFWVGGRVCNSGYGEMMNLASDYGSFGKEIK